MLRAPAGSQQASGCHTEADAGCRRESGRAFIKKILNGSNGMGTGFGNVAFTGGVLEPACRYQAEVFSPEPGR